MKLICITALLFLWTAFAESHPLHLSITNITYENGKLKISMKTFSDDWEIAYFHFHGKEIDFNEPGNLMEEWLLKYLEERFSMALDKGGIRIGLSIDSISVSDDSMGIEMSAEIREKPNSLYIYNAILTDIFPDQTNLVIFEFKERETGIKFDVRTHEEVVQLK